MSKKQKSNRVLLDRTVYEITPKGWRRLTGRTCEDSTNMKNNGVRRRLKKAMAE